MRLRHVGVLGMSVALSFNCGGSGSSGGGDADGGLGGSGSSSGKSGADSGLGGSGSGAGSGSGSGAGTSGGGGSSGSGSGGVGSSGASSGASGSSGAGASGSSGAGASSGAGSSGGSSSGPAGDGGPTGDASVYQMHNHVNRDGVFVDPALTTTALSAGTMHLDTTFKATLSGAIFASPLYVQNGVGGKGTFYVVTGTNNVYAVDEATGALALPVKSAGPQPTSSSHTASPGGIVGTPAIDPTTRLMVFDSATAPANHTIRAWSIDDFSEKWSFDVTTLSDPTAGTFASMTSSQSQRSAVLIVGGIAYVTYGGFWGDGGPYHGWVVGVPLSGAAGAKAYATPKGKCGMWAAGGPASDGSSVFVSTGNPATSGGNWGGEFAIMRFTAGPSFSGATSDYWFDTNATGDADLSGANPMLVNVPGMTPPTVLVQLGKDHNAYLLDPSSLKGGASPLSSATLMGGSGEMSSVPAAGTTSGETFVVGKSADGSLTEGCPAGQSGDLFGFKIDPTAAKPIDLKWCTSNLGGGSPSITMSTADGNDALVWTFGTDNKGNAGGGSNELHAWALATGAPVVTGSDQAMNTHHFTTPIAVHGRIMIVGDDGLYAYKP